MAKRLDKPIRLYVLAIFIVIAYGLLPLVSVFPLTAGVSFIGPRVLPFNGSFFVLFDSNGEISPILLVVTLILGLGSAAAAIVSWLGISEGRIAALVFITLNVAWWYFLVVNAILGSGDASQNLGLVFELLIPPLWLVLVWWNYTRPDISDYYQQEAELERLRRTK